MSLPTPSILLRSRTAPRRAVRRGWHLGLATALVWLVVGLSAGAWALQWLGRPAPVALPAQAATAPNLDQQAVLTAVRGTAAAPQAATVTVGAWQLLGVVSTPDGRGAALFLRNGERARPVVVGQALPDGGLVLQGISGREVRLGPQAQGPTTQTLRLPTPIPGVQAGGTAPTPPAGPAVVLGQ